jgi:hypothetical protein
MSAPAPKMGKVSDDELAAIRRWHDGWLTDNGLWNSLPGVNPCQSSEYIIVRALRAGVPLEKLL